MIQHNENGLEIVTIKEGQDDATVTKALFSGKIIRFRSFPEVKKLLDKAHMIMKAHLQQEGYVGPLEACECHLEKDAFNRAIGAAAKKIRTDPDIKKAWADCYCAFGLDVDELFGDVRKLRRLPSRRDFWSKRTRALPPHRDTWGSNLSCQVNWWMPLTPVHSGNSVLFYPEYFSRAIENSSARWDLYALMDAIARGEPDAYPLIPVPTDHPEYKPQYVPLEPGDMLAFSGAHLHASASNETGFTRFNLESRSVSCNHIRMGVGAANMDGMSPHIGYSLFKHIDTEKTLTPDLI